MAKDKKETKKESKQPSWTTQEYRDAKANPLLSNRSGQLSEEKGRLVAQAEADRMRAITGTTGPTNYPAWVEASRKKNPGESFQYFDNKTKSWIKVPALDPSKSVRAQAAKLNFDANGQPVDAFTRNYIKQADFGPDGQGYGARASQLLKAGYKPTVAAPVTPTPATPTPVPVTPGTAPVAPAPVEPVPVADPAMAATNVAATPYPVYGKVAATVREPSFTAAKAGGYQKPGVVGIVAAPNAGGSFAAAQPKTSNKQSLNGLGAQADFGRSFGDSYSKNGGRKDGLF